MKMQKHYFYIKFFIEKKKKLLYIKIESHMEVTEMGFALLLFSKLIILHVFYAPIPKIH